MSPTRSRPAQRRSDAAPLALVLAGWALAVAPLAHPLLAHGVPFLHHSGDDGWVHHRDGPAGPRGPGAPSGHHHAPGSPEHLQVPLLAAAPPAAFRTVVLASPVPSAPERHPIFLPRRWSREQPQAP